MRSRQELLEASGYANRPRDFDDLIRILDPELRLITPTDPEGSASEGQPTHTERAVTTNLTHDYLVHSLRDWLTRKQRETRRGRAELRLAERSALVECQAREPPSAVRPGMGEHPAADQEEGLDRAATQDDEAGGAGSWAPRRPDLALLTAGVLAGIAVRRQVIENRASHPGSRSGRATPRCRHHLKSLTSSARCEITAAGSILR